MLLKMSCPYRIEPHQVQGLDYIHIFPVVQWLVKKSMETRKESAGFVRFLSHYQFHKTRIAFERDSNELFNDKDYHDFHIRITKYAYAPRRRLKRDLPPTAQISKLKSAILEYGISSFPMTAYKNLDTLEQDLNHIKVKPMSVMNTETESQKLSENVSCLDEILVGDIISSQINEIMQTEGRYFTSCANKKDTVGDNKLLAALENKKMSLLNQIPKVKRDKNKLFKQIETLIQNSNKISENQLIIEKNSTQLIKFKSIDNNSKLGKLEQLIAVHMSLKDQESKFREQCKKDVTYLQKTCGNTKDCASIKEQSYVTEYDEFKLSINKIRLNLAKKNRACVLLTRQLDDVPRRFELTQYQRRFMELYNQVSAKHKETKQYYTLYNTMDDSKLYLSKELSLLNSIQDNYIRVISSSGREQFLKQFEIIVKGIKKNKEKVEKKCMKEKNRQYSLSKQFVVFMEQQRKYVTAVQQLTIECRKNEALLDQLRVI
ncbi:coiled-coil domain-containing protein 93 isoform X2 [Microplitis mediator]|nr:coiled-coil domain-containing protein 93 isoform X2 [Microplitis mediator]